MKIIYSTIFTFIFLSSFATAPTTPASNLHFNTIDGGFLNVGWTSGNGTRRVIICRAGNPVTFVPQNGVDYTDNTVFGSGQQVAPGEYVIYDNAFTSFFVTGLNAATQYYFAVFEYNGTGASTEYLTSSFLSGSATTSAIPTLQTSNAVFSSITTNSVVVNWTIGNGGRRLVVVREGSAVTSDPVIGHQYNVNSVFGSGETAGTGNYTVYNSSGVATSITNLRPGTEYFFAFYEFNGVNQPQYKTPSYTASVTTRSIPTVASSNVVVTKTDGQELALNWTNGNGQRRIIVARQGSAPTAVPSNGVDYAANPVFGQGQQLTAGEWVVYDDNFNAATISGLNPATIYYFKIFEYDGTGTNTIYLTNSFGSINASTAITPSSQTSNISVSNIGASSFRLQFTPGNGRARLIIGRKAAPVNVSPSNLTAYLSNANLGDGNIVMDNTTDPFTTVQNLDANSTYHFAIFEYNGFNQPLYLSPGAVFSATTSTALPVKLIRWEASPVANKINLQWTTASEINSDYFIVERSTDGIHFNSLATIHAAGSSQSEIGYSYDDANPVSGKSFYRLKMVDIDGHSEYSAIRSILLNTKESLVLLSNPVQNKLEFVTAATGVTSNQWQIINASGQIIRKGLCSPGRTEIDVSTFPSGTYWLHIIVGRQMKVTAFLKQ